VSLIAIAGGSGAGKTWLAKCLVARLEGKASFFTLDDFYRDRSHLSVKRRQRLNFDSPAAIDWSAFIETLSLCRQAGARISLPCYDHSTHSRVDRPAGSLVKPIMIVEGLWLFHLRALRLIFDFKIFIECPADLRFYRRLGRDVTERGRSAGSVAEQFSNTVLPMHKRHVQPQAKWADELLESPLSDGDVARLAAKVKAMSQMSAQEFLCGTVNS
jgi:uridine kinase